MPFAIDRIAYKYKVKTSWGARTESLLVEESLHKEGAVDHPKKLKATLTEASIRYLQVPQVDPEVVGGYEVLAVTVWVYRVHVIRMGICEHSSKACRNRRSSNRYLRQRQRPSPTSFSSCVAPDTCDLFHLLLVNLPQLHGLICPQEYRARAQ